MIQFMFDAYYIGFFTCYIFLLFFFEWPPSFLDHFYPPWQKCFFSLSFIVFISDGFINQFNWWRSQTVLAQATKLADKHRNGNFVLKTNNIPIVTLTHEVIILDDVINMTSLPSQFFIHFFITGKLQPVFILSVKKQFYKDEEAEKQVRNKNEIRIILRL